MMTEYASDTENQSGNAVEGIEYFKTKKVGKKELNEALDYAKSINNETLIRKVKNLK